ncbi:MAG: Minf_1886 family protein [Gemmataceae bacterium]
MRHPDLERLVETDTTWPYEAYEFVLNALDHAAAKLQALRENNAGEESEPETTGESNHVDGKQIALAARELAQQEFGQMAPVVFQQWGIRATVDLGSIIFKLIEIGLLNQNEGDSLEDFDGIYSIPEDLLDGFRIEIADY